MQNNSLIAVVNNKAVSYKSIENKIDDSFSYRGKNFNCRGSILIVFFSLNKASRIPG